jgi:dihydroorotase
MMTLMNTNRLPDTFSTPGFVDIHVHLREPGTNTAETIASGTLAAAFAGYVLVGDMSNNPGAPTWTVAAQLDKRHRQLTTGNIPLAAHAGQQPEFQDLGELARMAQYSLWLKLYAAKTTGNKREYEAEEFREIASTWHPADPLRRIGVHAGTNNMEDFIGLIAHDLRHPLHFHHVNDPDDVEMIVAYRKQGLDISCGVTAHHLLKNSQAEQTEGWFARMMPPLAKQHDSEKLMHQLASGDIDIVESDHAPHSVDSNMKAEAENPDGDEDHAATCFGVPGIELTPQLLFYQVERGNITMERLMDALSTQPAALLGVKVSPESVATWKRDLYRINEEESYAISGSRWTPYLGNMAVGRLQTLKIGLRPIIGNGGLRQRDGRFISERGTVI